MKRRKYLKYSGVGLLFSSSGCLSIIDENDDNQNNRDTENPFNNQRVIEPEHDINYPINNEDSWRPNYLGENMDKMTSIDYSRLNNASLYEEEITGSDKTNKFAVRTFTSEDSDVFESNESVDYTNEFVAVVETGSVYTSDRHQWVRVEEVDDGYVLYGYYRKPFTPDTNDNLSSLVKIENTKDMEDPKLYVSIVVDTDHQIVFNSTEGVVDVGTLS